MKHLLVVMGVFLTLNLARAQTIELDTFWASEGEKRALSVLVEGLTESGFEVQPVFVRDYNSLRKSVFQRFSIGHPPTLAHWLAGGDLRVLAEASSVNMLPEQLFDRSLEEVIYPEVLAAISDQGQALGIPVGIHLSTVMVYNRDMLESVGFKSPPESWEAFFRLADALQAQGKNPIAMSDQFWMLRRLFNSILGSIGQKQGLDDIYLNFDASGELLPNLKRVYETLFRLRNYADPEYSERSWTDVVGMTVKGETAISFMGDFAVSEITNYTPEQIDNVICSAIPGKGFAHFGVDVFVSFPNASLDWSKDGRRLVEAMLDPTTQARYVGKKGGLPVVIDADQNDLGQCGSNSLAIWIKNKDQRIAAVANRDNANVTRLHRILPWLWKNPQIDASTAAKITLNYVSGKMSDGDFSALKKSYVN